MRLLLIPGFAGLLALSVGAFAGKADVIKVSVECPSTCTFNVTVRHDDAGWQHYADLWEVLSPQGKVLGKRVLYHPHDNEQPFTRSLSNVAIPPAITEVVIRARDSRHGWGGAEQTINYYNTFKSTSRISVY